MNGKRNTIAGKPFFLLALPVFFVLHGYTANFNFIPVKDAMLLLALYLTATVLLTALAWFFFRDITKAALLATCIMALHFFFGSFHDFLKKVMPGTFITKYTFLLPLLFVLLILLLIWLKRKRSPLFYHARFLNILFGVFLAIELVSLVPLVSKPGEQSISTPAGFTDCISCEEPDIYFILADEYAGNRALADLFGFDDSLFIRQLADRGFHTIPGSFSNYNYTPFSVASILNMDYLALEGKERGRTDLVYAYETIRESRSLQFLRSIGYTFYNYSVFDFEGQPARTRETFLPAKTRLITSQTLLSRFDRDIRFNLVTKFKSKRNLEILTYANKNNNEHILELTSKIAATKTNAPKFVYTHLMMPHYPYYFDRAGKEQAFETLQEGNQTNKTSYIEYLQYCNARFLELIDQIKHSSPTPPIIILMGDHGFRHFTEPIKTEYHFMNLASIYLPEKNYSAFRDSSSAVNMFRALFNTAFKQQLPYLKDSTSYLKD